MMIKCDNCKHNIKINPKDIKILKRFGDTVVEGYFCTKCNTAYITTVTDASLRADKVKAADLLEEYKSYCRAVANQRGQYKRFNKPIPQSVLKEWADESKRKYTAWHLLKQANVRRGVELRKEYLARK